MALFCADCRALPEYKYEHENTGSESPDRRGDWPEIARLRLALVLDRQGDNWDSREKRLLKCPTCGAYYLYIRDEDEPHYPHNYGGELGISMQRLDPISLIDALQEAAAAAELVEVDEHDAARWAALEAALTSEHRVEREHAVRALLYRHAGDRERVQTLLLEHEDPEIARMAADLLRPNASLEAPPRVRLQLKALRSAKGPRARGRRT
jgi:hypothetical protein